MTESSFSNDRLVKGILSQIHKAIDDITLWNKDIDEVNDYLVSPDGMKTLAATSMLLEAIGEGVKRIDMRTNGELLPLHPEIPWHDIMCMRNHIAHGYFDIDADLIFDAVKNDLAPLKKAIVVLEKM